MYSKEELSKKIAEKGGILEFIQWITTDEISDEERKNLEESKLIINGYPCLSVINFLLAK